MPKKFNPLVKKGLDYYETSSGSGATNLSASRTSTSVTVASDTGTDASLPAADSTNAGVMTAADKSKLDGIASGAEANTVDSVNGQTGAVSLDADDIDDTATTNKFTTAADVTRLANTSGTNTGDQDLTPYFNKTTDDLDDITEGVTNKAFTATEKTKLSGIETAADVTDATNVAAAGAVMESDTSTLNMGFVVDEDDMVSNSATKVPTQQSVKAYVDTATAGSGTGDMLAATYDPQGIDGDAFARANHTGTQTASTISDFDTEVSNNTDVAANTTARHTHSNKAVLDATTASFTTADETKLDGIEAGADVTDATNVDTAGAVMESDFIVANGRRYRLYNPYSRGGDNQYKGQLHTHSDESFDVGSAGNTPSDLATAYKTAGYDFLSITDHDVLTTDPGVTGITFIPGIEEYPNPEVLNKGHITAFNTTTNSTADHSQGAIDDHKDAGDLVCIAHPNLTPYVHSDLEMLTLERYNLIEVFNPSQGTTSSSDYTNNEDKWDLILTAGKRVYGTAVDDCHDVNGSGFNQGWVLVNADSNTLNAIVAEIAAGNFYASNGADVSISVSSNEVTASTSSAGTIEFIGRHGDVLQTATSSTSSTYTILGNEQYIRVKVTKDTDSTEAWSQPLFLEATDEVDQSPIVGYSSLSNNYRNAVVNGNFDVWQRGTSFSAAGYAADRWNVLATNVSSFSVTRQSINDEFGRTAMRLQLTTKGAGTPDLVAIQPFETNDSYAFRNKSVTFSLLVRRNSTFNAGNMRMDIYQGTGTDEATVSTGRVTTTKDIANTDIRTNKWTRVYLNAFIRADTTQIGIMFRLNDSNIPDGSYIEVRQVQFHVGSYPLPYQQKSVYEELQQCYRYYYRWSNDTASGSTQSPPSSVATATVVKWYFKLPVFMRESVAANLVGTRGTDWYVRNSSDATNTNALTVGTETGPRDYGLLRFQSGTFSAGTSYHILLANGGSGYIEWDAEL